MKESAFFDRDVRQSLLCNSLPPVLVNAIQLFYFHLSFHNVRSDTEKVTELKNGDLLICGFDNVTIRDMQTDSLIGEEKLLILTAHRTVCELADGRLVAVCMHPFPGGINAVFRVHTPHMKFLYDAIPCIKALWIFAANHNSIWYTHHDDQIACFDFVLNKITARIPGKDVLQLFILKRKMFVVHGSTCSVYLEKEDNNFELRCITWCAPSPSLWCDEQNELFFMNADGIWKFNHDLLQFKCIIPLTLDNIRKLCFPTNETLSDMTVLSRIQIVCYKSHYLCLGVRGSNEKTDKRISLYLLNGHTMRLVFTTHTNTSYPSFSMHSKTGTLLTQTNIYNAKTF